MHQALTGMMHGMAIGHGAQGDPAHARAVPALLAAVLAAFLAAGCASVPVRESFDEAAAVAVERTGHRIAWPEVSADADTVDARIAELLARPLDDAAAAEIALLSNRRLHAGYADLARAAAERVAAGRPGNPFVEAVARFRDGGGTPQIELSVVQEVLDLFLLPRRRRIAAAELERARVDVAAAVVDLAASTRRTFLRYQAERQLLELDRQALLAVEAAWEMAVQLREAGNVSQLDLLVERDFYEQMKLEVARRELAVATLRTRLDEGMGLAGGSAAAWSPAERLPELPQGEPAAAADGEARAVERSLDLAAALLDLEAAAQRAGVARATALLPELELGAEGEREVEEGAGEEGGTEWWLGPSLGFRLPIFDQGQPRRVAARMEVRRRQDLAAALGVEVRSAARRAAARREHAHRRALHLRDVVLPLRSAIVEQTQLHYNGMFVGVFQLLDAKRREIEARRTYVEALRDYWLARTASEQIEAGRLPGDGTEGGGAAPFTIRGEGAEEEHG